jgi:hypothetical protein
MLELALLYKDRLQHLYNKCIYKEKYKYLFCDVYADVLKIDDSTWNKHQFASVDEDGGINGYISYNIHRAEQGTSGLTIMSFNDYSIPFARDVKQAIDDIFIKFNFRRLAWTVIQGNPAEKAYDKFIDMYNGNIIGVAHEVTTLYDGKRYNSKLYEILQKDYIQKVRV